MRVNLACVCKVNEADTRHVLGSTKIGPSAHMESLADRRMGGVDTIVSRARIMRNSLEERVRLGVGELGRVKYCHKVHREGKLPMHKRGAGAGTEAYGNPGEAMTGGGGWCHVGWEG